MYSFAQCTTRYLSRCFLVMLLLLSACAKNDSPAPEEEPLPQDVEPFTEGVIGMGMYSHGVDLGFFIKEIDFSRNDVKEQFRQLADNNPEAEAFLALLEERVSTNPFAAFGLMINTVICTYHIKGDVIMGKARGVGFEFDNYHDAGNDEGKVFLRTLVQTDEIAEEDRELSLTYTPSVDLGLSGSSFDATMYNREVSSEKVVVAGYPCQVATYTLKSQHVPDVDPDNPLPQTSMLHKLVVYTSDAFNKTINFTHPFYLPEDAGILKLETYFDNGEEPMLVMQPEEITPRAVTDAEMQIGVKEPVYSINDAEAAWKVLSIMLSGWGVLGDM